MIKSRMYAWWLLLVFLWAIFWYLLAAQGIERSDESWFLQVTSRVSHGETLYRDMFFGATPLSIYLMLTLTHLFGLEILVLKGIVAMCIASSIVMGSRILNEAGILNGVSFGFIALNIIFVASPWPTGLYTWLSLAFLMGTFLTAFRWHNEYQQEPEKYRNLLAAGICAGLCFASKQNIGLSAIAALLATVAVTTAGMTNRTRIRAFVIPLGAFCLTSLAVLTPVLLSGGTSKFIEYCFTGKKTYLNLHLAYLMGDVSIRMKGPSSIGAYFSAFIQRPSFITFRAALVFFAFLLPALAVIGAIFSLRNASRWRTTLVVICFAVAAWLALFPRPAIHHMVSTVPITITSLFYFWQSRFQRREKSAFYLRAPAVAILAIVVLIYMTIPLKQLNDGQRLSQIEHFRGLWISQSMGAQYLNDAQSLRSIARNHTLFIMGPCASFYYLITGLNNPTPFDYPLMTTFGFHGQEDVQQAILERKITAVCLPEDEFKEAQFNLAPSKLLNTIRSTMKPSSTLDYCTVYLPASTSS